MNSKNGMCQNQNVKKQNIINKSSDSSVYNKKLSSGNNISFGGPKNKKDLIIKEAVITSLSMLNETNRNTFLEESIRTLRNKPSSPRERSGRLVGNNITLLNLKKMV